MGRRCVGGLVAAGLLLACGPTAPPLLTVHAVPDGTSGGELESELAGAAELVGALALCRRVAALDAAHSCGRASDREECRQGANRWPHRYAGAEDLPAEPDQLSQFLEFCREGGALRIFVTEPDERAPRLRSWERFLGETEAIGESIARAWRGAESSDRVPVESGTRYFYDGREWSAPTVVFRLYARESGEVELFLGAAGTRSGVFELGAAEILSGVARIVEERAQQEIQMWIATHLHQLLGCHEVSASSAMCPPSARDLKPAHFLRSSCSVLESWRDDVESVGGSMGWDLLGSALESDLLSLPENLACVASSGGASAAHRTALGWARVALYLVGAFRESLAPADVAQRLWERLEGDRDAPREARVAALLFRVLTRLPDLSGIPPSAILGVVQTLALEAGSRGVSVALQRRAEIGDYEADVATMCDGRSIQAVAAHDVRARLHDWGWCGPPAGEDRPLDLNALPPNADLASPRAALSADTWTPRRTHPHPRPVLTGTRSATPAPGSPQRRRRRAIESITSVGWA